MRTLPLPKIIMPKLNRTDFFDVFQQRLGNFCVILTFEFTLRELVQTFAKDGFGRPFRRKGQHFVQNRVNFEALELGRMRDSTQNIVKRGHFLGRVVQSINRNVQVIEQLTDIPLNVVLAKLEAPLLFLLGRHSEVPPLR